MHSVPPPPDAPAAAPSAAAAAWRGGSAAMFDTIAPRYDLLNLLMSFGLDKLWRRRLVRSLALPQQGAGKVLDVATGTGDVALALLAAHPDVCVVGLDPSANMLARAAAKGAAQAARLQWVAGDAQALPFADGAFAASCISFGIRNVPDRAQAVREMVRVTRAGGRVSVLELGEPRGLVGLLARAYVHRVVPWLGALLSGRRAYAYLSQSIAAFPPPAHFAATLAEAGLARVRVQAMAFGAAHLYVGEVAP